jgi:hypothetical protein
MRFSVKSFALTCGILIGLGVFLLTWWIIIFDGSSCETTFIGRIYRGYNISPLGSLFGLIWGFIDGLIGGAVFAWLYNLLAKGGKAQEGA